jgi:ubiquinone/menaquinone biosynthesis C-methylase UbiE/uncharacterized protein YbaR (Trm112 family)
MVSLKDLNEGMTDSVQLVCPICHSELMLEKSYRYRRRVQKGEIHCSKGCAVFPIVDGIPIISKPELFSVTDKELRRLRRLMSKDRWQKSTHEGYTIITRKGDKTFSSEPNVTAIAERLREIEGGVVMDIGCGGGFTTERVLQSIKPSVYSVSLDINFDCAKPTNKRAKLLGMSDRNMEICADARQLPFPDQSFSAAYTRDGFNHFWQYADILKEAYRILKNDGSLVVTEENNSFRHDILAQQGLNYEERIKELKKQGYFIDIQEFVENVKQTGFNISNISNIDDMGYVLVEAKK